MKGVSELFSASEEVMPSSAGTFIPCRERMSIFIDYDNLIRSFKESISGIRGALIDFREMKSLLLGDCVLAEAKVYSGFVNGYRLPSGLKALNDIGFMSCLEELVNGHQKGVDMCMGLDAAECAMGDACDTVMLVTGDADYVPVVRRIKASGKRAIVASFRTTLSNRLKDEADEVVILDGLRMIDTWGIRGIELKKCLEV